MGLDDFFDAEVAIVAGVTAAAFSPQVRGVVRRGAVLGLAGVMSAGDAVVGAAKGAAHEARQRTGSADGGGAEAAPVATPAATPAPQRPPAAAGP
jgi:hypothetical protein